MVQQIRTPAVKLRDLSSISEFPKVSSDLTHLLGTCINTYTHKINVSKNHGIYHKYA